MSDAPREWVFQIDYGSGSRQARGDRLSVGNDGAIRLYLDGKLVGHVREGFWVRVFIAADQPSTEAQ